MNDKIVLQYWNNYLISNINIERKLLIYNNNTEVCKELITTGYGLIIRPDNPFFLA